MTDLENRQIVTPKEVMKEFKISRPTFNQWVKNGVLNKIQIPGTRRIYITTESILKLLNKITP
jgi:predicted site-specific integrase-resolvase